MLVADASVVVAGLTEATSRGAAAREVLRRAESLHAPQLIDLEVVSAVRRLLSGQVVSHDDAARAMADLPSMLIRRYEHGPFLGRVWSLRDNLMPYEPAYVALAEALEAPVVTTDARLAGAPGPRCGFRLLTD